jgi:hypothetical protein
VPRLPRQGETPYEPRDAPAFQSGNATSVCTSVVSSRTTAGTGAHQPCTAAAASQRQHVTVPCAASRGRVWPWLYTCIHCSPSRADCGRMFAGAGTRHTAQHLGRSAGGGIGRRHSERERTLPSRTRVLRRRPWPSAAARQSQHGCPLPAIEGWEPAHFLQEQRRPSATFLSPGSRYWRKPPC